MNKVGGQKTNVALAGFCDCIAELVNTQAKYSLEEYFAGEEFLEDLSTCGIAVRDTLMVIRYAYNCLIKGKHKRTKDCHVLKDTYERIGILEEQGTRVTVYQCGTRWTVTIHVFSSTSSSCIKLGHKLFGVYMEGNINKQYSNMRQSA